MKNTGIQKLRLNSTGVGDEVRLCYLLILQIRAWSDVLNSVCYCCVQGAKAIAEMLKTNTSLRFLELNNNLIDYSVCNQIVKLTDFI